MHHDKSNRSNPLIKLKNTKKTDNVNVKSNNHDKIHHKTNKSFLSEKRYQSILKYLRDTYPRCFTIPPVPLVVGIHKILAAELEDRFSKTEIRKFLKIYTTFQSYRDTIITGASRYNLDGSVASKVTKAETASKQKRKYLKSDDLFKSILEDKLAAVEFLEQYLPNSLKERLDIATVTLEKETYIEEHLIKKSSDVVFSVKTKQDKNAFIYILVEHQNQVDHFIAFRLWKYMILLAERHTKQNDKELPLIYPTVFYSGTKPYNAPLNLWDLFADAKFAREIMTSNYCLINLQAMSDEEICRNDHISLMEYLMKHINTKNMIRLWEKIFKNCSHAIAIDIKNDNIYIKKLLWYSEAKIPENEQEELTKFITTNLSKVEGESLMRTIADKYIDEGIEQGRTAGIIEGMEKGIEKGIEKTAIKMLKEKSDVNFIKLVTGLSSDQILKLKSNNGHS